MSQIMKFIKTTAMGGLLVIVPIAIVLFVLAQLFFGLHNLSQSLVSQLGLQMGDALIIVGITIAALVGLCFITGLVVRTRLGVVFRTWLNNNVANRIPMYKAISSLTKRFVGLDGDRFTPIEVDLYGSSARVIGFKIENLPGGRCTVFIPSVPVATVGNIYVVAQAAVKKLDASVADALTAMSQWGVDTAKLYKPDPEQAQNKT